jgi:hypothetical protein
MHFEEYVTYNEEKGKKSQRFLRIRMFLFYLSPNRSVLSIGTHWVSWWSPKYQKPIPKPTSQKSLDLSDPNCRTPKDKTGLIRLPVRTCLTDQKFMGTSTCSGSSIGLQRALPDMFDTWTGHVWSRNFLQWLTPPTLYLSSWFTGFQIASLDMSGQTDFQQLSHGAPDLSGFREGS